MCIRDSFGVSFVPATFEDALERILAEYPDQQSRMAVYPHVASRTTESYIALFDGLLARREEIIGARNLHRDLFRFALNQIAF